MSEYLPEELLEKVFIRLPVKLLLRCTSICKKWYTLISNPQFISEHLNFTKSIKGRTQFLVQYSTTESDENFNQKFMKHYVIYCDKNVRTLELVGRVDFQEPMLLDYSSVVGCCNGVVCLPVRRNGDEIVVLWNPLIRRSLRLPKPETVRDLGVGKPYTFGFGFDHVKDDYKVLRVYSCSGEHSIFKGLVQNVRKVEIFRLSTGLWEDITKKAPFSEISLRSQADLKGVAHWIGVVNGKEVVVTFDMHEEVFGVIGLPKNPKNGNWVCLFERYLLVFEEKLFLFRQLTSGYVERRDKENPDGEGSHGGNRDGEGSYGGNSDGESSYHVMGNEYWKFQMKFDIWWMEEYRVSESWIQLHSGAFNISARPLAFRNNSDLLWVAEREGLVSNKIGTNTVTSLGELDYPTFQPSGLSYIESLVLLDKTIPTGGNDDIVGILQD